MKVVLLAAGFGTRLRPLTDTIPKCLVPIRGKPLLSIWLDLLFGDDAIERALVNTHYLAGRVVEHVRQSPWAGRIDLVHEDELLGTGGTLLKNRNWIWRQAVMVAHADNLTVFDPRAFMAAHARRPAGCMMTMMTFDTDAPQTCGIVEAEDGVVLRFHEKVAHPPGNRANAAVYIMEPEIVDFIAAIGSPVVDISTQVLPHFLGQIAVFHNATYHRDIGTPESLQAAEEEVSDMLKVPGNALRSVIQ